MNSRIGLCLGVGILLLFLRCGPKVRIPPEIDLMKYESIGFIGFSCDAEGNMDEYITEKFLQKISGYQKEARIIELGSQEEALKAIQADRVDQKAIQAIGQKHNVDAILTGNVDVSEVATITEHYPDYVQMSGSAQIGRRRVKAAVKVTIRVALCETDQGVTVWADSVRGEEIVKQISLVEGDKVVFDAIDPGDAYRDLVRPLIRQISTDFEVKYKRIKQNR